MNIVKKIPLTIISTLLVILLPFVVLTLVTSKTAVVNIRSFVVLSGSMQPLLQVGSVVYAQRQAAYALGDVISFTNDGNQTVTHRIVGMKDNSYITQGDANNSMDSGFISKNKVIGKVFFYVPYLGYAITQLKSPIAFVAAVIIPTILFILFELRNIKIEIEKETEKKILKRLQQIV